MRFPLPPEVEAGRDTTNARYGTPPDTPHGLFRLRYPVTGRWLIVLFGGKEAWEAEGMKPPAWEHASVSVEGRLDRTPTWEEMAWVAGLFWCDSEWLVQYRPAKADHVNVHEGTLHWWRLCGHEMPRPPRECV